MRLIAKKKCTSIMISLQKIEISTSYIISTTHPLYKLTGVLAKQVSPPPQSLGAPLGQGRWHVVTASTHDVPQKFPCAETTTCTCKEEKDRSSISSVTVEKLLLDRMLKRFICVV